MSFTIEKGIPIPTGWEGGLKRTLNSMEIGDSAFIDEKLYKSVRVTASKLKSEKGMGYLTRRVDGGWRIWRIK